jgi:periplasmic divalent cation tolerance protein
MTASKIKIVMVTTPDLKTARQLARCALTDRLVACANLIPKVESHYWWQGKIESRLEILILFKTTADRVKQLKTLILAAHPYDTPEFLVLSLTAGDKRYLAWLKANLLG